MLPPVHFQGGLGYFSPWKSVEFISVLGSDFAKLDVYRGGEWATIFPSTPPQTVKPGHTLYFKSCNVLDLVQFPFTESIESSKRPALSCHKRQISDHDVDSTSEVSPRKLSKIHIDLTSDQSDCDNTDTEEHNFVTESIPRSQYDKKYFSI